MFKAFEQLETFLRFDRFDDPEDIIRGRSTYLIALTFIFVQAVSFVALISAGPWSEVLTINVITTIGVTIGLISIRYQSRFVASAALVIP